MTDRGRPRALVVTGTDTDVGKTVVTAAVVAAARALGLDATAYKPTQTGWSPASPATWPRWRGSPAPRRPRGCACVPRWRRARPPRWRASPCRRSPTTSPASRPWRTPRPRRRRGRGWSARRAHGRGRDDRRPRAGGAGQRHGRRRPQRARHAEPHHADARSAVAPRDPTARIVIGAWPSEPDDIASTNREHLAGLPEGVVGPSRSAPPVSTRRPSGPPPPGGSRAWLSASGRPDAGGRGRSRR